ncbi:MAG: cyclic nucleotide-binding domain-containing protein [Candidatus Gracilibacteria bacterium]|nr:cyclic nucleotide-binding domain-containing protein [Candidatus Gracilibacteria bacterium]MDQ7022062.1 cyclic nucleotide-binding domain-containing protein [Candidatus Gracilibacteria bacterium]
MTETIYNLSIFKGIERETVESIILNCEEENFVEGEIIMMQGADSNGKGYIIKNGSVKISINGTKIVDLSNGNMVGEIALLNEEKRTATVEAISDTTMIVLTLDDLIDMINSDENKINKEIMRRIEENLENS